MGVESINDTIAAGDVTDIHEDTGDTVGDVMDCCNTNICSKPNCQCTTVLSNSVTSI